VQPVLLALRVDLARQRRAGQDFSDAWDGAVAGALAAEPIRFERQQWAVALAGTRSAWARAYMRAPASAFAQACETLALA
jgi:hypothetical protein